ncbi:hypothetical protein [Methylotenera sp.]|uniref:hypothetical protein n=1 Tax=Methylotenera sp. TaxID=2051956 RepID=UPI0024876442|nr:hypothetical protein [Methylotenera sp.]MDI1362525.1 hypothetical protein [Methylotenera sp.]
MFDRKAMKAEKKEVKPVESTRDLTLSGLTIHELLAKRAEIDTYLPSTSLIDLDLEHELLMQYHQTKALLAEVIKDEQTPANQKAQIVNTCSNILSEITKSQATLYNAERLKIMEQCLTNALKEMPTEVSEKFFLNYERELGNLTK